MLTRNFLRAVIFGLLSATAVYALLVLATSPQWKLSRIVSNTSIAGTAKVIAKEPKNHGTMIFSYYANNREYFGRGVPELANLPTLEHLSIGDDVRITYSRTDPSISVLGTADDASTDWRGLVFGVLPAVATIVGILSGFYLHHRARLKPFGLKKQSG